MGYEHTKILNGYIDGNVRQWFTKSGPDGYDFVLFPTFDPPELVAGMKPGEDVGHCHDCGFFMLQNRNCCHCREDGVVELLDYTVEDVPDIRKTLLYTCATSDLFHVDFRGLFDIEPCEWLDLGEHDYRIFGSQCLEVHHVALDLNQGRTPDKTRSRCVKGQLGALKGSTVADSSPITPKNPIVELIDSDDDAFDKIAGMGRVTRSAAAKGVSPLGVMARCKIGVCRKDPALHSGNVTSKKRAPRAPIKFCSPVQELHPYKFPHLDKACKLYDIMFSDEGREKYAGIAFSMIPQPDGNIITFTGKRIWEVFAPGQMMEGDIMDFLIDDLKGDPERNVDLKSEKRILPSPYFITVVLDCMFFGERGGEFNVEQSVRDFKIVVKDDEDLLTVMLPLVKPMVLSKDKSIGHSSLYVMNRYRNSIDILDPLPYGKNHRPSKNTYHKDCEEIITRLVQVMQVVYGQTQYMLASSPIGVLLQRDHSSSLFLSKGRISVDTTLSNLQQHMMVKRSLVIFEIMILDCWGSL